MADFELALGVGLDRVIDPRLSGLLHEGYSG